MDIDFSKLISVSGVDDLFELSHSQNDKVFLKSLKTNLVSIYSINRSKVMNLANIQVYTTAGTVDLKDLFLLLKNSAEITPNNTADKSVYYDYFLKVCPTLDKQKVYFNNLKQILKWHQILLNFTII